jgi:hypothetical protein
MHSRLAAPILIVSCASLVLHCSSAPESVEGGPNPPDSGVSPDSSTIIASEAGTIDAGREASAPVVVCGGSRGDPNAVPLLDWQIWSPRSKYAVVLGADSKTTEPILWTTNAASFTGRIVEQEIGESTALGGGGLFDSVGGLSGKEFARALMPETNVAHAYEKTLGWTSTLESVWDLRTRFADTKFKTFRVSGHAAHDSDRRWSLLDPVAKPNSFPSAYYVESIEADRGMGWFVTVLFDHPCKAAIFDTLVGSDPLSMLAPPAPHTRAEISKFLVDNDVRLLLTVVTFGAPVAALQAALSGTQASAATLDAFESTLRAMKAALKTYWVNPGTPDYASIAAGTNPSWVIGKIRSYPIPQ